MRESTGEGYNEETRRTKEMRDEKGKMKGKKRQREKERNDNNNDDDDKQRINR